LDIYTLIPASEIRALREEAPSNLATLCLKTVEKLTQCVENACISQREQQEGMNQKMKLKRIDCNYFKFILALNCIRLLTRLLPYIFEDPEWRGFFWSTSSIKNPNVMNEPNVKFYFESFRQ
jgi:hypothetical protein